MASTLGPRGMRLWDAYVERVDGERGRVLLEEACRLADRLDRLDALLCGREDEWFRLRLLRDSDDVCEVQVDNALVEARQQQLALQRVLSSLEMRSTDDGDDESWIDGLQAAIQHAS